MRLQFEPGTDVAMIALWDPGAIDVEGWRKTRFRDRAEFFAEQGAIGIRTGADGSYLLEVVYGEPVPALLAGPKCEVIGHGTLRLPSGTLIVDGVDEIPSPPTRPTNRREVPAGVYDAEVRACDFDEELTAAEQEQLTVAERRALEAPESGCMAIAVTVALALLWTPATLYVTLPGLALLAFLGRRSLFGKRAEDARRHWEELQRCHPGLVVTLTLRSNAESDPIRGALLDAS